MSRIGKLPVKIPAGVKASVANNVVSVEGPKGKLSQGFDTVTVDIVLEGDEIKVSPKSASRASNAMHGTARSIIAGMVNGVVNGYQKVLEIKGVGFKAELKGKTLGIVGFGRIGQKLGKMAKAIGMNVIAFDIFHIPGIEEELGIPYVEMDELLAKSDFISVHAPAVDGGALINAERIAKMKDGVVIINTSRGTNVDEAALLDALNSGKVRAAGLDVYADEPATNVALYSHPMVSCTPHIGSATVEAQGRIGEELVEIISKM